MLQSAWVEHVADKTVVGEIVILEFEGKEKEPRRRTCYTDEDQQKALENEQNKGDFDVEYRMRH